ncbi:hypothetical protein [Microbacterium sp.]
MPVFAVGGARGVTDGRRRAVDGVSTDAGTAGLSTPPGSGMLAAPTHR